MFEDRGGHTTGRIPSYGFLVDTVTDYCIGNAVYEYFCEDDYTVGSNKIFCATNREACVMTEDGAECIGSTTDTPDGDVNFGNRPRIGQNAYLNHKFFKRQQLSNINKYSPLV